MNNYALPKLNAPTYQITIPSTYVTISIVILVKEQKHLMMQESEDLNEIANTVSTLVVAANTVDKILTSI